MGASRLQLLQRTPGSQAEPLAAQLKASTRPEQRQEETHSREQQGEGLPPGRGGQQATGQHPLHGGSGGVQGNLPGAYMKMF